MDASNLVENVFRVSFEPTERTAADSPEPNRSPGRTGFRRLRGQGAALWRNKVVSGSAKYIGANVVTRLIGLALLPVWTAYLTPAQFGIIGVLASYVGFLAPVLMLGIHGALVRHYHDHKNDSEGWKRYFSSNLYFLLFVGGVITAGIWFFAEPLWNRLTSGEIPFRPLVQLAVAGVFFRILVQLVDANLRARQAHTLVVSVNVGIFVLSTAVGLILVIGYQKGALGHVIGALVGPLVVSAILLAGPVRGWLTPVFEWCHVRSALSFGLPLVPHTVAAMVMTLCNSIILEKFRTLEEVGVFNLAARIAVVMSFVVISINQAWTPRFYEFMKSEDMPRRRIVQYANVWLMTAGLMTLGLGLFGSDLIVWMSPKEYHGATVIVAPLVLAFFFNGIYFFGGQPLFFLKKTRIIPVLTASSAGLSILLNLALVPKFGVLGAAAATLGTMILLAVSYHVVASRFYPVSYPWGRYFVMIGAVCLCVVPGFFVEAGTWQSLGIKMLYCIAYAALCWILWPQLKRAAELTVEPKVREHG